MKFFGKEIEGFVGERLDKFLASKLSPGDDLATFDFSRSRIQKMIKHGCVLVNGGPCKASYVLACGDEVVVEIRNDEMKKLEAEDISLDIAHEEEDFFVINKPAGMVVHPDEDGGHMSGTVVNAVLWKVFGIFDDFPGEFFRVRPGIVHRLDKDTSGLLIIAKTKKGYDYFVDLFKKRAVRKKYLALVKGVLEHKEGIIDSPIARSVKNRKKMDVVLDSVGKRAISKYKVLEEYKIEEGRAVSLIEVEIETGRTHQIRVHMSAIGHPVVGDDVYGNRAISGLFKNEFGLKRQFLHACSLRFKGPKGGIVEIEAELPEDLEKVVDQIQDCSGKPENRKKSSHGDFLLLPGIFL